MSSPSYRLATEVLRLASPAKPADAALREVLKAQRDLPPETAREVSRMVFQHYRWRGWTRGERGAEAKLRLAQRLAMKFAANPRTCPPGELRERAIPEWTAEHLEVSDEWLRSLQAEPKLWLRAKRGQAASLARKLGEATGGPLPDSLLYTGEKDLFRTAEFHAGEFEIQDIASQAVGWLCAPRPGETWWDACAGEGGKTLELSDLMENKGLIWASDRAAWRLEKLKRRAARAGVFNYRAAAWDGGVKLPTKTKFDGVLLDAPCSGLGTWQRNPHARWTTKPEDVRELAEVQQRLLAHATTAVKPGGKLIYSACTLTRAETTDLVQWFNASQPEFAPLEFRLAGATELPSQLQAPASALALWPQDLGGNGMFVAAWRRKR